MTNLDKCQKCGKLAYQGDTVTVTLAEFEALKKAADRGGERTAIARYRSLSHSPIARNPKLAEFIINFIPTMTVSEIAKAVKSEFGDSGPSRSSIYRFVQAVLSVT